MSSLARLAVTASVLAPHVCTTRASLMAAMAGIRSCGDRADPGPRSETEAGFDLAGPEVLDDDAEQRDGACQQGADGLSDRPAHLDRQVERGQQVGEVDPTVHD